MKRFLFFYGTLLPHRAPPEIASTVRQLRRIGKGQVRGWLYDLGEYPGAILARNGPVIQGQVFQLPDDPDVLKRLDEYEGFDPSHPAGSLFVRKRSLVALQNGKKVGCWVYAYNRQPGIAANVTNGDFGSTRSQRSR